MLRTDSKPINQSEKAEVEEMAKLLKQLSPKEKERILYMVQGVALISDAVAAAKAVGT